MSLEQELDSSSAAANSHVFRCPLAQFERPAPLGTGGIHTVTGAPPLNPEKLEATLLLAKGGMSPTKTARRTALGRSTLYREIEARESCLPLAYVLEQILR